MNSKKTFLPIFDLHCDLLAYLAENRESSPVDTDEIGCALPFLQEGNVKLQVLAIYSPVEVGSSKFAAKQGKIFGEILNNYDTYLSSVKDLDDLEGLTDGEKTGVVLAIENAAGFCEEADSLKDGFTKLDNIVENMGPILYITITHHTENRFGGGNFSNNVGLKADGKSLLDYLDNRKIAVDLSHTSDALAHDIFEYTLQKNLDIPLLASHSNFRSVWKHPRNLPDEMAKEIIKRQGLIGMNFVRAFVNDKHPEALTDHILCGLDLGAENSLCFGADFFYPGSHPDQSSRVPFFFEEHENATKYSVILEELKTQLSEKQLEGLAFRNALNFLKRIWS